MPTYHYVCETCGGLIDAPIDEGVVLAGLFNNYYFCNKTCATSWPRYDDYIYEEMGSQNEHTRN